MAKNKPKMNDDPSGAMPEVRKGHIGIKLAQAAAEKGPNPHLPIPNAVIPSVRPNRSIGCFPDAAQPARYSKPVYKGTTRFQRLKSKSGGADGKNVNDEI